MARWSLMQPHYIAVPDTEWEQKETNRDTGKQVRKVYKVPRLLDPKDPGDYTHKELEAIIVCHEGKGEKRDLVFEGEPTPDMAPLDKEAEEISERASAKWVQPMGNEALPGQGSTPYGEARIAEFMRDIAAIAASQKPSTPLSVAGITPEDFKTLQEQVAALAEQNKALLEKLAATTPNAAPPTATAERRV